MTSFRCGHPVRRMGEKEKKRDGSVFLGVFFGFFLAVFFSLFFFSFFLGFVCWGVFWGVFLCFSRSVFVFFLGGGVVSLSWGCFFLLALAKRSFGNIFAECFLSDPSCVCSCSRSLERGRRFSRRPQTDHHVLFVFA